MLNNDIVCVFVWFIWVFLIIKILKWHFSMNFYYIVNCYFSQFGRIIMIQILWYNICFKSEKIMFWNVSRCPMIDRLNLKVNDLDLTLLQNQGHMWPLSGTGFFFLIVMHDFLLNTLIMRRFLSSVFSWFYGRLHTSKEFISADENVYVHTDDQYVIKSDTQVPRPTNLTSV